MALLRFLAASAVVILVAAYFLPYRLFSLPMQRPWFWLLIMVLYPLLSVLPQEIVFRSFFFQRYSGLFPKAWVVPVMSALSFGFVHIVMHNWVAPVACLMVGGTLSYSYTQHRSLKWATLEHAAYGCMAFSVGIGLYFYYGGTHG